MINHVSTLEQGQKLKALGWNKPTKFVWVIDSIGCAALFNAVHIESVRLHKNYPSLLADESLDELPSEINRDCRIYYLDISKGSIYGVSYTTSNNEHLKVCDSKSLPIAATDMLIWCIENNYVKGHGGKAA